MYDVEPTHIMYKNDDLYSHKSTDTYAKHCHSRFALISFVTTTTTTTKDSLSTFIRSKAHTFTAQLLLLCSRLQLHIIVIITKLLQVTS